MLVLFLFSLCPFVGMAVIVEQKGNSKLYRGEITDIVKGNGLVDVFLVDYGRTLSVSWMNLRKIEMQFISMECQVGEFVCCTIKSKNSTAGRINNYTYMLELYSTSCRRN